MVRSVDSIDGCGFVLLPEAAAEVVALFMVSPEVAPVAVAELSPSDPSEAPPCLGPGSLIFDLENIASCPYERHRIDGRPIAMHFVVQMGARAPTRAAHIT